MEETGSKKPAAGAPEETDVNPGSGPGGFHPLCSECQEALGFIQKLRKHFCPPCWIHHCNIRFRKRLFELGKPVKGASSGYHRDPDGSLAVEPRESVLIYYDGSDAAKALLNLIRDTVAFHLQGGENYYAQRLGKLPFPFSFTVLYLIDGVTEDGDAVTGNGNNETINFLQSWLEETQRKLPLHFPAPLAITTLEKSLSRPLSSRNNLLFSWNNIKDQKNEIDQDQGKQLPLDSQLQQKLCLILLNLKSKTSRIDFVQILRQRLLVLVAKELDMGKVMLPENQTSMAVNMFSIMASGRGEQLAEQMNLVTEFEGVDFCRPLMDLSTDDLRDYLTAATTATADEEQQSPSPPSKERIDKNKNRKIDSIRRQCEEFIVSLQQDYPGTVPTLTRIGAKLEPRPATSIGSTGGGIREDNGEDSTTTKMEKCKLCQRHLRELDAAVVDLCYGCRSIFQDMKRPELLQESLASISEMRRA